MKTSMFAAAALAVSIAAAQAAHAEPGLANKVYEPYVRKGVTEVELRGGRLNGGPLSGESGAVVELEHGFSDRFSLAVLGEFERHAGEKSKLDAVAVEGVAHLGQIPGLGVDVGAYAEYEQRIHNESGVRTLRPNGTALPDRSASICIPRGADELAKSDTSRVIARELGRVRHRSGVS